MPAIPIIAAVVTTAATVYSAQQGARTARRAADLGRRNAAASNQANVNAAQAARDRDQTAALVEQNQQAAADEMAQQPAVIASDTNVAANRRANRNTFRMDDDNADQTIRV